MNLTLSILSNLIQQSAFLDGVMELVQGSMMRRAFSLFCFTLIIQNTKSLAFKYANFVYD